MDAAVHPSVRAPHSSPRSKLTFTAQGRKRRLFRLDPETGQRSRTRGCYHVQFVHRNRKTTRSLGTTLPEVAIAKAKALIEAAYREDLPTMRALKVRSDYSPLRAICDRYIEKFGTDPARRKTARGNVGRLERVVQLGAGRSLDACNAGIFVDGDALVRRYEEEELKRVERDERGLMKRASELTVRNTIDSTLRQARSIFTPGTMHWFADFSLPDLTKFRSQGYTKPDRPKPRPLDYGVLEALHADALRLRTAQPAVYAAFLLFLQCGMRNSEIEFARRDWIRRREDGTHVISITKRPEEEFDPKGNEGEVPIGEEVVAELLELAEPGPEGFLVRAAHPTERHEIVNGRICEWAGQWIRNRSKVIYELRRYAGSLYYDQVGDIVAVKDFLRHADLATTMKWYWYRLKPLAPLQTPGFLKQIAALTSKPSE